MTQTHEPVEDRITMEAAAWFNRNRQAELSRSERARFANWIAESPVHVREYLSIAETWGALQSGRAWPEQTRDRLLHALRATQTARVIDFYPDAKPTSVTRPKKRRLNFRLFAIAASLAAVLMSGLWWYAQRHVYGTGRGEQRSVVLPDGSIVQLNTLSKIVVRFDDAHRRIELPHGEAYFRVARDAARPFEVETPFAVVRAVGTEFNVYNRPGSTRVAVVEGKIQVTPRAITQDSAKPELPKSGEGDRPENRARAVGPIALKAHQSVDIGVEGKVDVLPASTGFRAAQIATAWMQRRLIFENERLDRAVQEFNRYNRVQMRVMDPELATLRISGVFGADDPAALRKYLQRIQQVTIEEHDGEILLRR